MSIDTVRRYIARLPEQPATDSGLYRVGSARVAGSFGSLRIESVFQPVTDRSGGLFGHHAYFRAIQPDGARVSSRAVLHGVSGEEAVVRFDRLCRTVHALNRFTAGEQRTSLFLGVDHLLLNYVPEEHGTTFHRVLDGFGVLPSRVVIVLPPEAAAAPGLLEYVMPSYRLHSFRIAVDVTGWRPGAAPRLARLRPDYVRVRWDAATGHWAAAARDAAAHLVVTHIEQPADRDGALAIGADLLQGHYIGQPEASIPAARDEQRDPKEAEVQ